MNRKILVTVLIMALLVGACVYIVKADHAMAAKRHERPAEFTVYEATHDGEHTRQGVYIMVDNKYHHEYIFYDGHFIERDTKE
ncbi:MAG: hypothetical protein ACI39G_04690 [Pseudoramibacter sp.]